MSKALILVLFLAAYPSTLVGLVDHVIISVDSSSGHDNATCLQPQGQPCQTLEYVHGQLKSVANESVVIEICGPVINLTRALLFNNFIDLSIRGMEDSLNKSEIFCNTSYSGLSFVTVTRLSLSYIQLTYCGLKVNSTMYNTSTNIIIVELSALHMLNCRDVNITNTVVYRSDGTGISMLDTNGNVRIEYTNVVDSSLRSNSSDNELMFGGSGLHIEFSYCTNGNSAYGHLNCTSSEHYSNANYTIRKCNFTRNEANATQTLTLFADVGPMSSGAGLYIGFAANASYLGITFEDCIFSGNRAAKYSGGMKLYFYGTAHDNQVSLIRTTFSQNSATKTGGGLDVTYMQFRNYTSLENNSIIVTSCNFTENLAGKGGGVFIFSGKKSDQVCPSGITFTDCTWSHNRALYGAAVYIMLATWASVYQGRSQLISFINCNFTSNLVMPHNIVSTGNFAVQQNGAGAVYCIQMIIKFSEVIKFEDNNGTALHLSDSVAVFSEASRVVFYNNSGTNGGAVSLKGQSFLEPNGSSNFSFINNRARQLGGGLYFKDSDNSTRQICFIFREESTQKSSFNFTDNTASSRQGDHIFVSSFTSCNRSCHKRTIFDCIGFFNFSKSPGYNMSTLPITFALDHNDSNPFEVIPGFPTYLPLTVKDALGNNVSNMSYQASLESSNTLKIDSAFKYVSNNTIKVTGEMNKVASLRLQTTSSDFSLLMNIKLVECPPGYVLDHDNTCKCGAYYGIQKCDPEAYVRCGVWMGKCDDSRNALCTGDCPVGYCICSVPFSGLYPPLPLKATNSGEYVCSVTRQGTLCGQCKPGYSVYFNSRNFECGTEHYCHLGLLFFILSTIIPLTIVFVVITVLDTNIAGHWNGFIFYSQMVNCLYIYVNGARASDFSDWLMSIYSFFNLEIFNIDQLSFCIWKGAGVMDILMVKLGTILFSLALVMATVFILNQHTLTRCFPCLARRRYSVINGISAFFILCYSQCTRTCFQVLDTNKVYDDGYQSVRGVVFYDGSMSPFQGEHIKYATVAVVFLIFIVILPPVLLLFYPLLFKMLGFCGLSESKFATFLWKMMPIQLLDSFQNPFKDNCRFFAGLYFLYRVVAMFLFAVENNLQSYYGAIELEFIIVILLHSLFQPYKKTLFNIIDALLFFLLALINSITLYNYIEYTVSNDSTREDSLWSVLPLVLLFLPLTAVCVFSFGKMVIWIRKRYKTSDGYEEINPLVLSYSR